MNLPFTIGIVDDDPAIRRALGRLLRSEGFEVRAFSSAAGFLADKTAVELDCLILDLAMPGGSGIELQREMERLDLRIPIIFLTGEGDVPASVKAMKAGAVDFLTKPVRDETLFAALGEALKTAHRDRHERELLRRLTEREKEILRHTISGRPNKHIGADLGISEQTVKVHRMNLNHKLGTTSLVDLVHLAERHGLKAAD
jgi:FixJ family two-component response regulator